MPDNRSPLQRAYDDAWDRRDDLESARARERRDALAEYTIALDARLKEKYDEQIRAAREEEARVHAALMEEREKEALARQYPYPLGTVMVEWESQRYSYRDDPKLRRLTGRRGVLEVITSTSEHPGNRSYSLAGPGDLVIRILKKNGKPGRDDVSRDWRMRGNWVPEGTDLMQANLSWPEVGAGEQAEEVR